MSKLTYRKFNEEKQKILARLRERATAFSDDAKQQETRLQRQEGDFLFFCSTYLPHYFDQPFDRPHFEWANLVNIQNTILVVIGPPETGKSVIFEIALTLWKLLNGKFRYGILGCNSLEQSADRVEWIRTELDENARIKQDFGDLKGRRWKEDDFITKTEIRLKAISFRTRLFGLIFKNWRPDYCSLSDLEDDKTVVSPRMTKKIRRWILQALLPRLKEPYTCIYNGNKLHPKMALVQLSEKKDEENKKVYPGGVWTLRKRGKSQFPHLWPKKRIEQREKAVGRATFARTYDFIGIDDEHPLKIEWFIEEPPQILVGVPMEFYGGIDPAPEPNRNLSNDNKAIVIRGKELETGLSHIVDAWIKVATVREMIAAGFDLYDRWHKNFNSFLLAGPKVEELYRQLFDAAARERGRLPLPIVWRPEQRNKIVKLSTGLGSFLERGLCRFVTQNGHVVKILDEAEMFPDGQMGGLDALHMSLEAETYAYTQKHLVTAI
ncbi:MAG: hypothetical protein ACE5I1_17080 [bacterium]